MSRPQKKRGPQRRYDNGGKGAPGLFVRLEPDVYEWVKTREEGARNYLEFLIRQDMDTSRVWLEEELAWRETNPGAWAERERKNAELQASFSGLDLLEVLKASFEANLQMRASVATQIPAASFPSPQGRKAQ